jgi:para-aminobenzoate synthetase component 2
VLAGLPVPFPATRYHSLVVERDSLPAELEVTGWTAAGLVMALRHREHPVEGVQFHPESILTESGHDLLRNWLERLPVAV